MNELAGALLPIAFLGAGLCLVALVGSTWSKSVQAWPRLRQSLQRPLRLEEAQSVLLQADLEWLPVRLWIMTRLGAAFLAGATAFAFFHLWLLAGLTVLAAYQLIGGALERRRRRMQLARHRALLEAVHYGAAVMSRAGNAVQMLAALAEHGPSEARRLFAEILDIVHQSAGATSLADAVQRVQRRLADPMFDDIALALTLHERRGSRLVPALETLGADWDQTLALQREAKALRAGVEASVLILTVLPFAFLACLELLAPDLLAPFRSPLGEVVFGAAVVWMALGYRLLQKMAAPPQEARVALAGEAPG
jgi:Flp pilus assembly protein TadB